MSTIKPQARPRAGLADVVRLISMNKVEHELSLIGVRGYYRDSMGVVGINDRKLYDDALIAVWPTGVRTFNFNTDPGAYQVGIATLLPGVWTYVLGIHGLSKPKTLRYEALVQGGAVTVTRDGKGHDMGYFGINIHKGGYEKTSSLGCQTIYPAQWPEFIDLVKSELKFYKQKSLKYILIEGPIR